MTLEDLKQQRSLTRKNMSRIKTIVEASGNKSGKILSSIELKCRLGILESYFKQGLGYQTQIEKLDPDDNGRGDLEDLYVTIESAIQMQLGEDLNNSSFREAPLPLHYTRSKLPALKLPSFSGKYSEYKNFILSFINLIDKEAALTNIEKFNHLINCLQGQALETVKAFQVTSENYPKALERLKARYDNSTMIFMETIKSLFELPSAAKQNASQLRSLIDNVSALYGSLLSIGSDKNIAHLLLIHLVMDKVDEATQTKWKESLDFISLPTWEDCAKVLERRCQFLESASGPLDFGNTAKSGNKTDTKNKSSRKGYSFSCTKRSCIACSSNEHFITSCPRFKQMEVVDRFKEVKRLGLCLNCLSQKHQLAHCSSTFKCKHCSRSHHSLLHRPTSSNTAESATSSTALVEQPTQPVSTAATHTHREKSAQDQVILATAIVLIRDASGCYQLGRALLDSCSQVNFISEECVQKLRLSRERHHIEIQSIGDSVTNIKHKTSTTVKSRVSAYEIPMSFYVTSHIAYQPDTEVDVTSWNLPSNIQLADNEFFRSKRVDLLIGTEIFFDILSVGQIKLASDLPTLQKTLLGWVVSGRYKKPKPTSQPICMLSVEESVDANLQRLWKLDESPTADILTTEQRNCVLEYTKTVYRNSDGRVVIQLPFKDGINNLGQSYTTAMRRFLAQERRLSRCPDLQQQYIEFMEEYRNLGHMSAVEKIDLNAPHYYIPHHHVLKPTSTTTKLRVVFDASCKTTSQKSLNDLLAVGPTLQNELYILLLRFRFFRYALTADIVKMYRQILVDPDDRKFQYILWRSAPNDEIRTYQLNTVTYGTASAPYLAVQSLNYIADTYESKYPIGANTIKTSFYVDDLLCGADTLDELSRIKHEVTEVLRGGCFTLAKWHSNHLTFRNDNTMTDLNVDEDLTTSTLGIKWDQFHDVFLFSFQPKQPVNGRITKRSILSIASALFDPLGLIAPVIIVAKIILQELWLLKLNWDESVPQNLETAWNLFIENICNLSTLSITRYCGTTNQQSTQIHGFCDSSIRAYGCCIYVRSINTNGKPMVTLLTAKSRVAPIKKQSLPKLELCGALLLARLFAQIKPLFKSDTPVFLWSDSQIVLHWLKMHSATLSTFVGNRVSEIQDLTTGACWRHVPTKSNPADVVSRGCPALELNSTDWFSGPSFLKLEYEYWPRNEGVVDMEEVALEKRKSTFKVTSNENYILKVLEHYNSYTHCLRVIAWMFRFHQLTSKSLSINFEKGLLFPQNLQQALWCIVWNVQQQHFADEIYAIKQGRVVSGALKFLNPFIQIHGGFNLLKVGGRLELADSEDTHKHPIILPGKSHFTELYIRHLHKVHYHAGAKALVALLRLQFWVVNARDVARRIVRSCVHCVKYKPKLLQQTMGNLPVERLTPSRPFSRCGIDFCGPFDSYLRIRGRTPYKTYVAIFVCFSTKAVHIEIVSDLSTDAFLGALKRMIGRRGLPTDIYCDNATNFVGANRKLQELKEFLFAKPHQESITNFCTNQFINFHFIPPRAPHFGGLWEAAVKSAKGHLNRSMANARLTFEELNTVMINIEAILNSRPITPLSADPSDLEALTPGHFLIGSSLLAIPEREQPDNLEQTTKWARVAAIRQLFWRRWSSDYISSLQARTKWTEDYPNVVEGSMVIIHEDNAPPQRWSMGRVIKGIPGKDGRIRVVDVKTTKGILRRPIHKLAVLPA